MNSLEELVALLGEKNVEELQKQIVNIIINRIADDVSDWQEYIFEPDRYKEFFDDCFEKATERIKNAIVGEMSERMMNALFAAWRNGNNGLKGGNENGEV